MDISELLALVFKNKASDLIFKGEMNEIKNIMAKSHELGMQTFDQLYLTSTRKAASVMKMRCATRIR